MATSWWVSTIYTSVGALVIDEKIYVGNGRGYYSGECVTALVFLTQMPYANVSIDAD